MPGNPKAPGEERVVALDDQVHPDAWTPLEGRALMLAVRDILVNNPERHEQNAWVGNYYLTPDEIGAHTGPLPFDQIRPYATQPMPVTPVEPNVPWPVCGSTGCALGWAAVLSAPPGTVLEDEVLVVTPDGEKEAILDWVAAKMGITLTQAAYIANPIRARERLIRILDALIEDPAADLYTVP